MNNLINYYNDIIKYIYLLDMNLIKKICNKLNIYYNIFIEIDDNNIKKTNEILHKEFIIDNILHKIKTNESKKIIYKKKIQKLNSNILNINEMDYIYYGEYKTTNKNIKKLLLKLTDNKFKFGAISQKIIKSYWKDNKLINYKDFSKLWLNEYVKGDIKYKELAYNQFMKNNGDKEEWFKLKNKAIIFFNKINLL